MGYWVAWRVTTTVKPTEFVTSTTLRFVDFFYVKIAVRLAFDP